MRSHYFALFLSFGFMIMIIQPAYSVVTKCYGSEMEQIVCDGRNNEFCLILECEKRDFRGCGSGHTNDFESARKFCAQLGIGAYKPGGLHLCFSDMCNEKIGKGNGNDNVQKITKTERTETSMEIEEFTPPNNNNNYNGQNENVDNATGNASSNFNNNSVLIFLGAVATIFTRIIMLDWI